MIDPAMAKLLVDRELADRKLFHYSRFMWPIIQPGRPFVNNWHIGAICFPANVKVETEIGPMAIGDLVESGWSGRVLSHNHETNRLEWRRVTCRMKSPGKPTVRVETAGGVSVSMTDDHPVFVSGVGYVSACRLRPGDEVVRVQPLRQEVLPKSVADAGRVLQSPLLRSCEDSAAGDVRRVWSCRSKPAYRSVSEVLRRVAEDWRNSSVSAVRQTGVPIALRSQKFNPNARRFLRSPVLRTFLPRGEERGVHRRRSSESVSVRFQEDQEVDLGTGRVLFHLFGAAANGRQETAADQPGSSSHRLGQGEQREREFGHTLQEVSQRSEGNAGSSFREVGDVVNSVSREARIPEAVYNIEVEGSNNYFADSVLVHNCEHLEALTSLQIRRLIINIPPRHMKSILVSVMWFTWVWKKDPESQWLYSSYDQGLVERDSDRCRDIINHHQYRESFGINWDFKDTQNSIDHFRNTRQGSRICTTPERAGTGLDSDYMIADDPSSVKDRRYPARLQYVADWWGGEMSTRGNDPATLRRLIVMQRFAARDLTGVQLAKEIGYEHCCFPAEYEPTRYCVDFADAKKRKVKDPIIPTKVQRENPAARDPRTEAGEVLWKGRFEGQVLHELKAELGATEAAGQLQQRPTPEEGTIFQASMFRRFSLGFRDDEWSVILQDGENERYYPMWKCRMFQAIDTASTKQSRNDPTACVTAMLTPDSDLLVYDVFRERIETPYLMAVLVALKDGPIRWSKEKNEISKLGEWPRPLLFQAVEQKSSGIGLIQMGQIVGSPFKPLKADAGKEERAGPVATMYYLGKVYHREGAPWLVDYEAELLAFPNGAHDDMVDATAFAGYLMGQDLILRSYLSGDMTVDTGGVETEDDVVKVATASGHVVDVHFEDD